MVLPRSCMDVTANQTRPSSLSTGGVLARRNGDNVSERVQECAMREWYVVISVGRFWRPQTPRGREHTRLGTQPYCCAHQNPQTCTPAVQRSTPRATWKTVLVFLAIKPGGAAKHPRQTCMQEEASRPVVRQPQTWRPRSKAFTTPCAPRASAAALTLAKKLKLIVACRPTHKVRQPSTRRRLLSTPSFARASHSRRSSVPKLALCMSSSSHKTARDAIFCKQHVSWSK
jgi:hypothetical protein